MRAGHGGAPGTGGTGARGAEGGGAGYPPYPEPAMKGLIRGVDPPFWANMDDFVFDVVEPSGMQLYVTVFTAAHYLSEPNRALGLELFHRPETPIDVVG